MTTKEKADALFAKHFCSVWPASRENCLIHAIKSVENTIEELIKLNKEYGYYFLEERADEQTEILNELKSRL